MDKNFILEIINFTLTSINLKLYKFLHIIYIYCSFDDLIFLYRLIKLSTALDIILSHKLIIGTSNFIIFFSSLRI